MHRYQPRFHIVYAGEHSNNSSNSSINKKQNQKSFSNISNNSSFYNGNNNNDIDQFIHNSDSCSNISSLAVNITQSQNAKISQLNKQFQNYRSFIFNETKFIIKSQSSGILLRICGSQIFPWINSYLISEEIDFKLFKFPA